MSTTENITTDDKMKLQNILPLNNHLKYNKVQMIHKIYHDKTPTYLQKIIKKAPDRYNSTIILPPLPRIDLFKTSLAFSGALIWNSLPPEFHKIESQSNFKRKVFHHFLNEQL